MAGGREGEGVGGGGARGGKALARANADGLALKSDNATIFIGVSCDAFSPQYGKASWEWRAGRLTVDFGNRQVAFETPAPKFTDGKCMG